MARPSMKEQRQQEILQAFTTCVARYGLEGSSLERIAEQAGLKRSLVRHHAGNRDELVQALADKVLSDFDQQWLQLIESTPSQQRAEFLLAVMFNEDYASDADQVLVVEALIAASERYPEIAQQLRDWLQRMLESLAQQLALDYPDASIEQLDAAAFGIISLYFNLDAMAPLGLHQRYRAQAQQAAQWLLLPLQQTNNNPAEV